MLSCRVDIQSLLRDRERAHKDKNNTTVVTSGSVDEHGVLRTETVTTTAATATTGTTTSSSNSVGSVVAALSPTRRQSDDNLFTAIGNFGKSIGTMFTQRG
jgi:hypothetical protein